MAGEHEPPVRYRGEPPRYSERVVDPENPVPARRGARRGRDEEWELEAYTPGEPRVGEWPADWDEVPLRPVRRRAPGEPGQDADRRAPVRPERESDAARAELRAPEDRPGAGRTAESRVAHGGRRDPRRGSAEPEHRRESGHEGAAGRAAEPGSARLNMSAGTAGVEPEGGAAESPTAHSEMRESDRFEGGAADRGPEAGAAHAEFYSAGGDGAPKAAQTELRAAHAEFYSAGGDGPRETDRAESRAAHAEFYSAGGDGVREAEQAESHAAHAEFYSAGGDGVREAGQTESHAAHADYVAGGDGVERADDAESRAAHAEFYSAGRDGVEQTRSHATDAELRDAGRDGGEWTEYIESRSPRAEMRASESTDVGHAEHGAVPADSADTGHGDESRAARSAADGSGRGRGDVGDAVETPDGSGTELLEGGPGDPGAEQAAASKPQASQRNHPDRKPRGGPGPETRSGSGRPRPDQPRDGRPDRRYAADADRRGERPHGEPRSTAGRSGQRRRGLDELSGRQRVRGSGAADRPDERRAQRTQDNGARPERSGREHGGPEMSLRAPSPDGAARPRPDRQPAAPRPANPRGSSRNAKAGKQKKQGPPLLDDHTRARYEAIARERNGLRAAWAAFRIRTDDLRRANASARIEAFVEDGFDRDTQPLTDRGYAGPGGGRMNVVGRPVEYRATTAQVAGLWPWSVGAGAPLIGTPLGSHLHTGAPVCFDPMNWFMRGSFITAPSLFVLGLNGFGKSSLVRRIVLGGVAQGITPLILADVKPDYRKMVEMVGGQVIDLGYGHGVLNPLAGGVLGSIVPILEDMPALQLQVTQELRARQVTLIAGLVELVRGARVRDYEETLISTALRILYREGSGYTPDNPPIMEDLANVIGGGSEELKLDAGAETMDEYHEATKGLRRSLRALTQGPFGAVFNGQTTTPIDTSAVAVCIDVSHIPNGDKKLKAAVMLACWADGFASVEAAHVLADAKIGPQRYFQVVMDELWQVLGLGDFMVDRVDELTRLQRGLATSLIMISHTIKDLQSLGSEAAIAKALGFLERARAKIFGALPPEEIKRLDSIVPFTSAEEEMVTSWSAPQALTGEALKPGQARPPAPGTGKFLLKIGEDRRPGIPFHMEFTMSEKESGIHETNQRFSEFTESTSKHGDEGSAA
ncbi:hypothetical protein [Nocardia mexicana]|uniref:AAA domain-containing protein n=1 Tax=Nocardia mexicana TaxID=279262 RepID=A0A370H4E3_9NOCA|nr:hypothetical protein [Nocardia mexicana]RDI50648.1 hypothetical protein DFR68_105125 [Nocardia mexicana]